MAHDFLMHATTLVRLASISALLCMATTVQSQNAVTVNPQKSLMFCVGANPLSFYPGGQVGAVTRDANLQIYSRLVEFESEGTQLVPGVAERWTVSSDGTEYTFYLRKGVQWHSSSRFNPSRELNAEDVLFSLERQWKTAHPFYKVTSSNHAGFVGMRMDKLLKSISKVDDHTLKISLQHADAAFASNLALVWASVQSKEYADLMMAAGTPEKIDQEPIGTGPFKLVEFKKDAHVRYKAFPKYYLGEPKIDNLTFLITQSNADSWAKVQKGECDAMDYARPDELDAMGEHSEINLIAQTEATIGYLAYNTGRKPFDDVRVRKALNMAINKKAIVEGIYMEQGAVANSPLPPAQWSHKEDLKDDAFDPEGAKKLLTEAGYPNGFNSDLWVMPVSRRYNPDARRVAELMKSNLARIGVIVEFKSYEWREYVKRMHKGEHQMGLLGWFGDNGDPDNYLGNLLGCPDGKPSEDNVAHFCNPEMERLLQQARRSTSTAERTTLYHRAQVLFKEQAPWLPIAYSVGYRPVRKGVVNLRPHPLGFHDFYGVSKVN